MCEERVELRTGSAMSKSRNRSSSVGRDAMMHLGQKSGSLYLPQQVFKKTLQDRGARFLLKTGSKSSRWRNATRQLATAGPNLAGRADSSDPDDYAESFTRSSILQAKAKSIQHMRIKTAGCRSRPSK